MALRSRLTAKAGRVFTKVSKKLEGSVSVKLLKVKDDADEYETIRTLTENVFFEYADNRKTVNVEIGADSEQLTSDIEEATHIEVAGETFFIRRGDTTSPSSTDVTWKLTGEAFETGGRGHYSVL